MGILSPRGQHRGRGPGCVPRSVRRAAPSGVVEL